MSEQDLKDQIKKLEDRVRDLENRLGAIEDRPRNPYPSTPPITPWVAPDNWPPTPPWVAPWIVGDGDNGINTRTTTTITTNHT